MSLLPRDFLYSSRYLLGVLFTTSLKPGWYTALTTQNTTENNCILSHAQNATAFHLNVCFTGIFQLLVTGKGWSAFPNITTAQVNCRFHSHSLWYFILVPDNTDILVLCNL